MARSRVLSGLSVAVLQYWTQRTFDSGNTPIEMMNNSLPRSKMRLSLKPVRRRVDSIPGLIAQLEHFTNLSNLSSEMPTSAMIKGILTYVLVSQQWWQHVAIEIPSNCPTASLLNEVRARSVAPPHRCLAIPINYGGLVSFFKFAYLTRSKSAISSFYLSTTNPSSLTSLSFFNLLDSLSTTRNMIFDFSKDDSVCNSASF